LLNWRPTIDLAVGLDLTVNYFSNIDLQETLHQ